MIRVCSYCRKSYGEKPPIEDKRETHGICQECLPGAMKEIEDAMPKLRRIA